MQAERPILGRQLIVGVLSRFDEEPRRSVQGRVFKFEPGRVSIAGILVGEDTLFDMGGEKVLNTDGECWNDGGGRKRNSD